MESREGDFELFYCQCGMLYTRNPLTAASKQSYYDDMARRCQDSRRKLGTAHYTLANQIKSVPLYSQSIREIIAPFSQGDVNVVDLGCAGGLFLLGLQVVEDEFNIDVASRFKVRGVAFDPREKTDTERYAGCPAFMIEEAGEKLRDWADVVTMFNLLEHVNNPAECLATVRSILRD
jgi:2-polyprenyl-3-methyl-5-hydroxy-6-metoxy-1,4-benzoquinol methylase